MKSITLFPILLISVFSLSFQKEFPIDELFTPPGTIKVSYNRYIDRNEIRNLDYCEFMHWTKKVFGNNSDEYISILPDTTVWKILGTNYEKISKNYLRDVEFRNYPVVGISFFQAQQFAKWRSDRVMEFTLIKNGVFRYDPNPDKDSFFTIEKYFTGKYGKVNEAEHLQYYPVYSIPDSIMYTHSLIFSDSLNNYTLIHIKKKNDFNKMIQPFYRENIDNSTMLYGAAPTRPLPKEFFTHRLFKTEYKYELLLNLQGNVAELTFIDGITFGGSYMDSSLDKALFKKDPAPNCFTGFRNCCHFEKWTGLK